jgi:hypothetical protein
MGPPSFIVPFRDRAEALAAHAETAQRILDANNAAPARAPREIDLHGLHASEAIDALQQRLFGADHHPDPDMVIVTNQTVVPAV